MKYVLSIVSEIKCQIKALLCYWYYKSLLLAALISPSKQHQVKKTSMSALPSVVVFRVAKLGELDSEILARLLVTFMSIFDWPFFGL